MRIALVILLIATSLYASAQKEPGEFSIYGGLGVVSFAPISGFVNGFAFDLGAGYTYFFDQNWGVHAGVGAGLYHAGNSENINAFTPGLTDRNGYLFDLYSTTKYRETHHTMFLNVPVMLQYQTMPKQKRGRQQSGMRQEGYYAMGGVKAMLPFGGNYRSNNTALTNLAYYPEFDNWAGTQKFAGLGVFDGKDFDNTFELKPFLMLALEGGIKWRINRNRLLYTGIYFDYGLNVTAKETREPFRNYVAVDQLTDFTLLEYPDKTKVISVGVKVRLAFFSETQKAVCPYKPSPAMKRHLLR